MSTKIKSVVLAVVVFLFVFTLSACNSWENEAEKTNRIQIHEHALTQREVINAATVDNAVDQISGNNH